MKKTLFIIFTLLYALGLLGQVSKGAWDRTRSTQKQITLGAGKTTYQKIELPLGTTQVVARIVMLDEGQQITPLLSLLAKIPGPQAQSIVLGTALTSTILGTSECSYRVFVSAKDASTYCTQGVSRNYCKWADKIRQEVIYFGSGNGCLKANTASLFFAFKSENFFFDEKIILEVVPWVDETASRGWDKKTEDALYDLFVVSFTGNGIEKGVAQKLAQCLTLKLKKEYTLAEMQNLSKPELNSIVEEMGKDCSQSIEDKTAQSTKEDSIAYITALCDNQHPFNTESVTELNGFIAKQKLQQLPEVYNAKELAELLHHISYDGEGDGESEVEREPLITTLVQNNLPADYITYTVIQLGLHDDSIGGIKTYWTFRKLSDGAYTLITYKSAWLCNRNNGLWTNIPCP